MSYTLPLKGFIVLLTPKIFLTPFHAAEQLRKERVSNSAELCDFPMSPVLCKQRRMSIVGSSIFADNPAVAGK